MATPEEEAAAKAASDAAAAQKAAADAAAAEAARVAAAAQQEEQKVPLSRLQAVIAQKAESERAQEALRRELQLANDTLEEFRSLGKRGEGTTTTTTTAPPNGGGKALSPQELQRLVAEEASKQNFNQRTNDAVAEGRKAHADFDKVVMGDLMSISPVLDPVTNRPVLPISMIEAALETGNAHEVLYELGKDAAEASRIMSLRPTAQAVALAKFADKLAERSAATTELDEEGNAVQPNVSRAPAPIKPTVRANGATKPAWRVEDTENFSTEQWIRNREKDLAAQRANK